MRETLRRYHASKLFLVALCESISLNVCTDPNTIKIGVYIVIGGLSLQTLSFVLYILLVYHTYRSLKQHGVKPFEVTWGKILQILFFSSAFFLVRRFFFSCPRFWLMVMYAQLRCIYRTIELGEELGDGYLANHEGKKAATGIPSRC